MRRKCAVVHRSTEALYIFFSSFIFIQFQFLYKVFFIHALPSIHVKDRFNRINLQFCNVFFWLSAPVNEVQYFHIEA